MLFLLFKNYLLLNYSFNSELFIFSKFEIEFNIDEKTSF
jgi:hypothetical protein